MKSKHIKQQKLIFRYEGAYDLSFVDENKSFHNDDYSSPSVDLYRLVQSCFEPADESILTCSCGFPEYAGISNFSSQITENEIFWHVDDDYFRFDRTQYVEEVRSKLNLMTDVDPDTAYDEDDYFGAPSDKETFLKLKNALDNYSEFAAEKFPRHKIILCPDENNKVYITETGKKIGFKNRYIKFRGKDFLDGDFFMKTEMNGLKNWASKIKTNRISDWSAWNSKGISFAQEIRQMLPPFFDVWYRFQGEKKEDQHILMQEDYIL